MKLSLAARERLARAGHAGDQHVDESLLVGILTRVNADLSTGCPLLRAIKAAMCIDDAPLGQLAEPTEGVAITQLHVRQRRQRIDGDFLQQIGRLDLAPY